MFFTKFKFVLDTFDHGFWEDTKRKQIATFPFFTSDKYWNA